MTTTEILTGIKNWVVGKLNLKQNVISDLADIRSGAQAGATSVQPADILSYFDNAVYDSGTHRINFYHGQSVIAYIDASPFIIDGMVNDVRIENGYLVIDFNTDSGKQDISIPLTDIFNPNNYYTKSETDSHLTQKQSEIDDLYARIGYYVCSTEGNVAAKTIVANNYTLGNGGSIKIKMTNANTVNNATLNINSTGAKTLYYDGERASAKNSWEAGETVEVYYDGTSFYANNIAGGSGSGDGAFDVSAKYPTSGVDGGNTYTLEGALAVLNANLSASKKKGGMSVKFVQSYDNKYVQFRLRVQTFTTNEEDWEGVDTKPTPKSTNLTESGGVASSIAQAELNAIANRLTHEVLVNTKQFITYSNGNIGNKASYAFSDYLDVSDIDFLKVKADASATIAVIACYNTSKEYQSALSIKGNASVHEFLLEVTSSIKYVRICTSVAYADFSIEAIRLHDSVYDISANHLTNGQPTPYDGITSALGTDGANIPLLLQRGGMMVKFIGSVSGEYEQHRLMATSFTTDETQWQGVDKQPTNGSRNLVESGGVAGAVASAERNAVENTMHKEILSVQGKYIVKANGNIGNGSYSISEHISVSDLSLLEVNADASGTIVVIACYDENKTYIPELSIAGSTLTHSFQLEVVDRIKYVRLCCANSYSDFSIKFTRKNKSIDTGENLLDRNAPNVVPNKYIGSNGSLADNQNMSVSDYIKVEEGATYHYESSHPTDNYFRTLGAYNESKEFISAAFVGSPSKDYTVPKNLGVKYVRISFYHASEWIMFNKGVFKGYIPYHLAISDDYLDNQNVIDKAKGNRFAQRIEKDVFTDGYLYLDSNSIKTNKTMSFSANITAFSELQMGHGTDDWESAYISIDDTNVKYYGNGTLQSTTPHGLTIANTIQVSLYVGTDAVCHLQLVSSGNVFETTFNYWDGCNGRIFAKADSSTTLANCVLGWACAGYLSKIQLYGDSYLGIRDDVRWGYYLMQSPYKNNCLIDAYGGKGAAAALETLKMNLSYSNPSFIVWLLGMNNPDSIDSAPTEPNSAWLTAVESLIGLCKTYNIVPILATIPNAAGSTGVYRHDEKNEYVRESGLRYIDIEKAVGANANGEWYPGMLVSGDIHPTKLGAQTIYNAIIAAFPELTA